MERWYLTAGDFGFFWAEQLKSFSWLPKVYGSDIGFGGSQLLTLWFEYPYDLFLKVLDRIGLSWWIIEKLVWISVFALAIYSSHRLAKYIIGKNIFTLLTPLIFTSNTYFLLLISGGQLGVSWAYAFSPWVVQKFMETSDRQKKFALHPAIINGILFSVLVVFDLRIAYMTLGIMGLYSVFRKRLSAIYSIAITLLVAASTHLYWILPTTLASRGVAALGEQFTNQGMLKFLSFADFSHALTLLHPNWPENLFGKVYFLQPEFIVIPILAFLSLLFAKKNKKVLFFALLSLLGAFFAKGVNDPFGNIFAWCFTHIPGFVMFRDPSKFYLITALGYSILIPFVLMQIRKNAGIVIFTIFWFLTIRAVFTGQVQGVFKPHQLPQEYAKLTDILLADTEPSRTLWIPDKEGYAYFSNTHPLLTATNAAIFDPSVKYIIVPIDVRKRIFLNDYKYDPSLREKIISGITMPQDMRFHNLAVFENSAFSGMKNVVPPIVGIQQELANIGFGISIVSLFFWVLWIYLH